MQPWADEFYSSMAWRNCRASYKKSVGGLCERCIKRGLYVPGEIVHHKTHLTQENINNPDIALSFSNLELLCRDCHAAEHEKNKKRYRIGADGKVVIPPGAGPLF